MRPASRGFFGALVVLLLATVAPAAVTIAELWLTGDAILPWAILAGGAYLRPILVMLLGALGAWCLIEFACAEVSE